MADSPRNLVKQAGVSTIGSYVALTLNGEYFELSPAMARSVARELAAKAAAPSRDGEAG